ncbi:MAG TPA: hypothetical protein VMT18_10710, partial [Planctomycetota bacterium]|nr:hypothetical protein [Planctomycetota bacterium]
PRYVTLCQSLQRGDFPLWQTLVYGGSPFHANPENPTLYPPTLLLAWLTTPVWTINGTILGHLAFAALGMFVLLQRLGRRAGLADGPLAAGALLAATAFTFNLFMRRDHVNLVAYGAAHAWIPWMLLAADGVLNGVRPARSAGWLALCVALLFFTGGLYVIPYAYLALTLWMLALGVLGDARRRRRALVFGGLAAAAALLLVCAKLLPYRDWVLTTNRTGRLPLADALGTSLLTVNDQPTDTLWNRVYSLCGGPWVLVPALFALALWRERVVRVVAGLTLLGFAIALGGWTWRALYEFVPPFDRIRSAVRAWTIVNAFLPLLLGLGVAWLLSRPAPLRARPWAAASIGIVLSAGLALLLVTADPRDRDGFLRRTDPLDEVLSRTPNWSEAAARAQDDWRVGWPEFDSPEAHNEQFVASALGAETMVGYQGHVWPSRQEVFVYGPAGARIDRAARLRRLAAVSVRWLVAGTPTSSRIGWHLSVVPAGLQGDEVVENVDARARLTMPAVVVGVIDDDAGRSARALLDQPAFPIADAAVVSLPWSRRSDGERASEAEIAACDLVLVWSPLNAAEEYGPIRDLLRDPSDLHVLGMHLSEEQRAAKYAELVAEVASRAAGRRRADFPFERRGPDESLLHVAQVDPGPDARGRFVVASEPWSWYPGWRIEGLDEEPTLRIVEGISSAFLLPADAVRSPLIARYAPASTRQGALLAAVGLVLTLALLLAPQRGA